jgi:NAD-dependent dihydropyrimidine dehydrogenase PreA subunit
MKSLRYIDDVVTLKLDLQACVGCGACTLVCPHRVFAVDRGKVRIADLNGCMECGACVKNCPTGALEVTPGVGCAAYIIQVWIKGKDKAACGGSGCC